MKKTKHSDWKSKYGGMEVSEAKRLKSLEDENRRLKEIVADLSLDKEALKSVIRKTGGACECAPGCGIHDERVQVQRTPRLQAPRYRTGELPVRCAPGPKRESARSAGGGGEAEPALRLSAAVGRADKAAGLSCGCETHPPAVSPGRSGGAAGKEEAGHQARSVRPGRDGAESGMGDGLRFRQPGRRAGDPKSDGGGQLHTRVSADRSGDRDLRAGASRTHWTRQSNSADAPPRCAATTYPSSPAGICSAGVRIGESS